MLSPTELQAVLEVEAMLKRMVDDDVEPNRWNLNDLRMKLVSIIQA